MRDVGPRRHWYDSIPAQTLIALSFNILSLFAGGLISIFSPQFRTASWILALFPPILTIRGGIGGIFSGNLATMLHIGLIQPRLRENTPVYYQLISSVFVITLLDTLAMGAFSFTLNLLTGGASLGLLYVFAVVPPVACAIAMAISIPLTSLIAIITFRRGLDPDIMVYPILASVNDIVVTTAFAATIFLVLSGGVYLYLLWAIFLFIVLMTGFLVWRNRNVSFFYQTIREGTTVVIMSSVFGSLNGVFLSGMTSGLMSVPGLVVLYPSLTNALGNIGSIVGSTTTTMMALGYKRSLREEIKASLSTIAQVEAVAFLMHVVFGVVSYLLVLSATPEATLLSLIAAAIIGNLVSFLLVSLFALFVASQAFERGLNPDNVVIPVITTASDTVATLTLPVTLILLRVLGIV